MDDLIYNQYQIPKDQWRYGLRSSAATGCGWIAVYNALRLMGYRAQPESLIRYFQRQLPVIHGNAGTTILAPARFFQQKGFRVDVLSVEDRFDDAAKGADVCVLFYRWHKKASLGAHFVALRYSDGRFTGYNTYRNSTGPDDYGPSLSAFLKQRKYFLPVLITVQKPE